MTATQKKIVEQFTANGWTVTETKILSAGTLFICANKGSHIFTEKMICGGIGKRGRISLKLYQFFNKEDITTPCGLRSWLKM